MKARIPLLSPAGAAFALVCFFLPWGRFSCAAVRITRSGAELGGSLWIVFAAAAAIVVGSVVLVVLGRVKRARLLLALIAAAGLVVLVMSQLRLAAGARTPLGRMHPEDLGVKVGLGGIGTALGLLLALVTAAWPARLAIRRRATQRPPRASSPRE